MVSRIVVATSDEMDSMKYGIKNKGEERRGFISRSNEMIAIRALLDSVDEVLENFGGKEGLQSDASIMKSINSNEYDHAMRLAATVRYAERKVILEIRKQLKLYRKSFSS